MRIAVWIISAILAWCIGGFNLAIIISRSVYHEDIRDVGSGNPGFTNFRRVYGNKYAWFVFAVDLLKGAFVPLFFGYWFRSLGFSLQLGAAYTGLFVMLGHLFPVQFGFKGGKGVLVLLTELFVLDRRAGLIGTAVLLIVLFITKFMSLASMIGLATGAVFLFIFGCDLSAAFIYSACVLLMIGRHKGNIKRLLSGTENTFQIKRREENVEEGQKQ